MMLFWENIRSNDAILWYTILCAMLSHGDGKVAILPKLCEGHCLHEPYVLFLWLLAPSEGLSCYTTLHQHYVGTFLHSAVSRICNENNNAWNTFLYYLITIMSFNMSRFIEFITSFFLICVHLFLILTVNLKKKTISLAEFCGKKCIQNRYGNILEICDG